MARIVTVTVNPCVDKSSSVDAVAPERKLRCEPPRFEAGGGGLNVTHALKELGEESLALWTRGGFVGEKLAQLLDEQGVRHQSIPIGDATRENFIVFEENTTNQFRFGMPGPELSTEEVQAVRDAIAALPDPDYLVLSGSLPRGVSQSLYRELAKAAPKGTRVVLDASGDALKEGLDAGVFLVKPNLRELGQLVGFEPVSDSDLERASRELVESGRAELVLTSLGAGGAMLVTKDATALVRSPTVPIRSKVGAGDSMVAGTVLGLVRYDSLHDAIRLGVAAGAAAVMTDGTELCRREDVERLFHSLRHEFPSIMPSSSGQVASPHVT